MLVSRYRRLPASVKLLTSLLVAFLGLWSVGTLSFAYFSCLSLERTTAKEMGDSVEWLQKNLDHETQDLAAWARTISENPELVQELSTGSRQSRLLQILLPIQAAYKLDLLRLVSPDGKVLISSQQRTLGTATFQEDTLHRAAQTGLDLSGVLISQNDSPSALTSLNAVKSSQKVLAGLAIGRSLDREMLEDLRGKTALHLISVQDEHIKSSTIDLPMSPSTPIVAHPGLTRMTIAGQSYWVKWIERNGFDHQNIQIAVLKSTEDFDLSMKQLWLLVGTFGFLGAALVTGGTILGFRMTQALGDRIQSLTQATQQLAAGDLSTHIPVEAQDDVGQLAMSFNEMALQLKERDQLLHEQMQKLESTLTELHQTQGQMIQREKMSALGQMVAGVAHEINNPITFISGNISYIDRYTQDLVSLIQAYQKCFPHLPIELQTLVESMELDFVVEDLAKILTSVQVGSDRIREIVLSLRNFSRLDEAEFKQVDLHQGIENTLMILQHRLKVAHDRPEIQVVKHFEVLPEVQCYAGQLNQVFMNLLVNAVDALEDSNQGRSFQDIVAQPNQIEIQTLQSGDNQVQIAISDNGPGIPEDIRSRLFDPFFTTKPVGKGTGLGLSISYQVITEKHGGKIWCEPNPKGGSRFVIQIPIKQARSSAPSLNSLAFSPVS